MRICSPQLRLAPEATLGGEVYDRETLTRLANLGAEVEVILPRGQPCPSASRLRVTRSPLARGYRPPVSNVVFVPQIGALYRRRPFDVLRVHSLRYTGPGVLAARRIYRLPVPVVAHHHHVHFHGQDIVHCIQQGFALGYRRTACREIDRIRTQPFFREFKRDPCPGGIFVKQVDDGYISQGGHFLDGALEYFLELGGRI